MAESVSFISFWREQFDNQVARARAQMAKSFELLEMPVPDTFLGRWQHEPKPATAKETEPAG